VQPHHKECAIIHNYGHGGFGYQSSWGSAAEVLKLHTTWSTSAGKLKLKLHNFDDVMKKIVAVGNMRSRI
jgi:D-amino-acid oxidase